MNSYFFLQIQTIKDDLQLRLYGVALSLIHIWTFFYWNSRGFFVYTQSASNAEPLCFPFFPNCDLFRTQWGSDFWQFTLYFYLFIGILSCFLFFEKKFTGYAYLLLLGSTLLKIFLHLSNYNFMGNYHYMAHIITLAFLFLPSKRDLPKYLIVAFYLAAGLLKMNIDWLSGAAMIQTPYISGSFLRFSLFYVLFLELIFVFGLLHPNRWVRLATLAQFIFFHAFSWHIVGFFYPMVMFSLLSTFFIEEFFSWKNRRPIENRLLRFFSGREARSIYIGLSLFACLQVFPFILVKDPASSGAPRLSSLNMFDAKNSCHSLMVATTQQGSFHVRPNIKNLGVRLKCDPIVFLNQAHQMCRTNKKWGEIQKLSLHLFTRRVTSHRYQEVLSIEDVCSLKNPLWAEIGALSL